jgi:hypothetical protein
MPALPALSLITSIGFMQVMRERIPTWITGVVAVSTIAAAIGIACLPRAMQFDEGTRISLMEAILNRRLLAQNSVPILTLRTNAAGTAQVSWSDEGRSRFFLGRNAHATTVEQAQEAASRGRFTAIVPKKEYARIASRIKLDPLVETSFWVLAEAGSAADTPVGQPYASDQKNESAYAAETK